MVPWDKRVAIVCDFRRGGQPRIAVVKHSDGVASALLSPRVISGGDEEARVKDPTLREYDLALHCSTVV
jgi:hypothetical protein